MIELKLSGSAQEILSELQQLGFGRIQLAFAEPVKVNDVPGPNPAETAPGPNPAEEELPARRKRRSKAEIEAEKAPVKEPEKPKAELATEDTYWYSHATSEFFIIREGEELPGDAAMAQGDLEQLEDEAEYRALKKRAEKQAEKSKVASDFKDEVEEEAGKDVSPDDLLLAVNRLIDAYPTDRDVEAGTLAKQIMQKIANASKVRDVAPEDRPAVMKALQKAIDEAPLSKKRR